MRTKAEQDAIIAAIERYTKERLALPAEQLRAEIEASEREIREGWIGISDWLLSK